MIVTPDVKSRWCVIFEKRFFVCSLPSTLQISVHECFAHIVFKELSEPLWYLVEGIVGTITRGVIEKIILDVLRVKEVTYPVTNSVVTRHEADICVFCFWYFLVFDRCMRNIPAIVKIRQMLDLFFTFPMSHMIHFFSLLG